MKSALFYGGMGLAVAGAGLPLIVPSLPSALQAGPLGTIETFIINNQNWIVLFGILLALVSLFL